MNSENMIEITRGEYDELQVYANQVHTLIRFLKNDDFLSKKTILLLLGVVEEEKQEGLIYE